MTFLELLESVRDGKQPNHIACNGTYMSWDDHRQDYVFEIEDDEYECLISSTKNDMFALGDLITSNCIRVVS